MQWSVGVQTCPRDGVSYLDHTIEGIRRAGWQDFVIFAEPNAPVPDNVSVTFRSQRYGDWTNWICALFEMLISSPKSDLFVLFEDDITLPKNLRFYLEWLVPELDEFGCISLYTHPKHHRTSYQGWHNESKSGWMFSGAQGIVFTRKLLQKFVSDGTILEYRFDELGKSNAHKDCAIGKWAKKNGHKLLCHTPSLIDHLGNQSLIGSEGHSAVEYVGDNFDCCSLIGNQIKSTQTLDFKIH